MPKSTDKPTLPRRLSRAIPPAGPQDLDNFLSDPTSEEVQDLAATARVSTLLAMAVIQDAMKPADLRRIARHSGLAVAVSVPGPDWVEPIAQALRRVGDWREVIKRHGASRMQDKGREWRPRCAGRRRLPNCRGGCRRKVS